MRICIRHVPRLWDLGAETHLSQLLNAAETVNLMHTCKHAGVRTL